MNVKNDESIKKTNTITDTNKEQISSKVQSTQQTTNEKESEVTLEKKDDNVPTNKGPDLSSAKTKSSSKILRRWSIWGSVGIISLFAVIGLGCSIPGLGIDTLKFINSFSDVVDEYMPKGKLVISAEKVNNHSVLPEVTAKTISEQLEATYTNDVLSSINDPDGTGALLMYGEKYVDPQTQQMFNDATNQYHNDMDYAFTVGSNGNINGMKYDIDLNDVAHNLIDFDRTIAENYHYSVYTNAGITWLFQGGTKTLFSGYKNSDVYNDAMRNQSVISTDDYKQSVEGGLFTEPVTKSTGTYVANNKIWFINDQLEGVIAGLNTAASLPRTTKSQLPFSDASLDYINDNIAQIFDPNDSHPDDPVYHNPNKSDSDEYQWHGTGEDNKTFVTLDDVSEFNYSQDFRVLMTGAVFLFILLPISMVGTLAPMTYILIKTEKPEKAKKLDKKKK